MVPVFQDEIHCLKELRMSDDDHVPLSHLLAAQRKAVRRDKLAAVKLYRTRPSMRRFV